MATSMQARFEAARELWEKVGKRPLVATIRSFVHHNGITTSAALAFYFLMSLFPFLIFLASALASIELLYYFGPDRNHMLREQLPGSVFAVLVWIASTLGLGIYLGDFGNLNAMYGTLASFIVLMIWLQISAMAILLGAELNAQMARSRHARPGVVRAQ